MQTVLKDVEARMNAALEVLHDDAGKLFQASITPALRELLLEPVEGRAAT